MKLALCNHYDAILCLTDGTPVFDDAGLAADFAAMGDAVGGDTLRTMRLRRQDGWCDLLLAPKDTAAAEISDALNRLRPATVYLDPVCGRLLGQDGLRRLVQGLLAGEYRFDRYQTKKRPWPERTLWAPNLDHPAEAEILAECISQSRDLVNDTAEALTPALLASACQKLAAQYGFAAEIMPPPEGMGLFRAVAKGSPLPPQLIVLRYCGGEGDPICLVGKGITYDSGGLSLKRSAMDLMRFDMNGAATVLGALCAAARLNVKQNIIAVIAACENMIGSNAYRNGDILTALDGTTVYVSNTDAEGRLTMADSICYCVQCLHPAAIVEVAGLTGSVCSFLGPGVCAALTADDALYTRWAAAGEAAGEPCMRMPFLPRYRRMLESPFADLQNAAAAAPGITAGVFLAYFAKDTPFLHVDLGAAPFTTSPAPGVAAGATGWGVESLYRFLAY